MKPSQLLKEAKKYLAACEADLYGNKYFYICHALRVAANENATIETYESLFVAEKHIRKLLKGRYSLEDWLSQKYGITSFADINKIQRTRFAWIDSMVQYFESKDQ